MSEKAELKDRFQMALTIREKKAVDLANDLKIPKSAISQYLSGNRTIKDSKRLYLICEYLDVSEAWMMGFDVPMERRAEKEKSTENDGLSENTKALIDFAKSVPEDKAEMILRVMKSILGDD